MKSDYVFVDTETTGLNHESDEILSVSVIDDEGICLFHSLIKPQRITEWGEAEKVNGISSEMVEHAPTFESVKAHLRDVFSRIQKSEHVSPFRQKCRSLSQPQSTLLCAVA